MATIVIDGCEIHYEIDGSGPLVVLTPGGRLGGQAVHATADALAQHHRVVLWDRRNTGFSHVWFGTEAEQHVWADDLATLLLRLDLGPAWLAGASAGARVSYLTALRHPGVVRGLVLWSVSGGPYASQVLGYQYHTPFINEALRGGMEAVAATPFFEERISANADNRDRILATPVEHFVASMRAWNESFFPRPDTPVIAASEEQLRSIAVPTLVFEGNDDIHPPEAAKALAALVPDAELQHSAWRRDEWMSRYVGRVAGEIADLYPRLAPAITEFIARHEALA